MISYEGDMIFFFGEKRVTKPVFANLCGFSYRQRRPDTVLLTPAETHQILAERPEYLRVLLRATSAAGLKSDS